MNDFAAVSFWKAWLEDTAPRSEQDLRDVVGYLSNKCATYESLLAESREALVQARSNERIVFADRQTRVEELLSESAEFQYLLADVQSRLNLALAREEQFKTELEIERRSTAYWMSTEYASLLLELERLRECLWIAGLTAFMRDKPPEEVAEHLRSVIASHVEAADKAEAEAKRLREMSAEALIHWLQDVAMGAGPSLPDEDGEYDGVPTSWGDVLSVWRRELAKAKK